MMRDLRVFALALSLALCYAIDSTRAMELLHQGEEATELSRTHIYSETAVLNLRPENHAPCLQRRGLVARRLGLRRRCAHPDSKDFEMPHDHGTYREPLMNKHVGGDTSPKMPLDDARNHPGFETGVTRFSRKWKAFWTKFKQLLSSRLKKGEPVRDTEKPEVIIPVKEDPKLDEAQRKTLAQRFISGTASGTKRFWKWFTADRAENGVITATRGRSEIPAWAEKSYKQPWLEMEKSEDEMRKGIEEMTLPTLVNQMVRSTHSNVQAMGMQLGSTQDGGRHGVAWAFKALESLPEPSQAVTDEVRETQVLSVKLLYLYASAPEESQEAKLARIYLPFLDKEYQENPSHAGQGIAKYLHVAHLSLLEQQGLVKTAEQSREVKAIEVELLKGADNLPEELQEIVEKNSLPPIKNREQLIDLSANLIAKARKKSLEATQLSEEEAAQIDQEADFGLRTLFTLAYHRDVSALNKVQDIWNDWLKSEAHISDGLGLRLKTAHDMLTFERGSSLMADGIHDIPMAERLSKLTPSAWFSEFAHSESEQIKAQFFALLARGKQHEVDGPTSHLFEDLIEWAGRKIDPREKTSRFNRNDVLFALDTLYTHSLNQDKTIAQLSKSKLVNAQDKLQDPIIAQQDPFVAVKTRQTLEKLSDARPMENWEGLRQEIREKVATS